MAGKIFINYRRDDSAPHALTVAQYLENTFGKSSIFIDIDRLRAGQRFATVLDQTLQQCNVMLAIIGPSWIDALNEETGARRLDDPEDWVRLEVERALTRGIPVIPILVAGATLPPRNRLPPSMQPLVEHQCATLTTNGFRHEMSGLARDVRELIRRPPWRMRMAASIVVMALGLYGAHLFNLSELFKVSRGGSGAMVSGNQAAEVKVQTPRSKLSDIVHPRSESISENLVQAKAPVVSEPMQATSAAPSASPPDATTSSSVKSKVITGADRLKADDFSALSGKRVGLITNQTGLTNGELLVDVLSKAKNVKLMAIFVPEHGFLGRIEAGEHVRNKIDTVTGVPIYSLYGETRKPTTEMLKNIDVLIFDLQDVGVRFYTFISTLGLAMQAAAESKIPLLVLDRPNPLGGEYVSGFVLEENRKSFVGQYSIPIAHGMTVGELALMISNKKLMSGLDGLNLSVTAMLGWERWMKWRDISPIWIASSPNISTFNAALLYPGTGFLEATSISEGRGTDLPFTQFGADWMDNSIVAAQLNSLNLSGVRFDAASFRPQAMKGRAERPRYEGRDVSGVRISVTDHKAVAPVEMGVWILYTLRQHARSKQQPEIVNQVDWLSRLAGTRRLYEQLSKNINGAQIIASWKEEVEKFRAARAPYLLYK